MEVYLGNDDKGGKNKRDNWEQLRNRASADLKRGSIPREETLLSPGGVGNGGQ